MAYTRRSSGNISFASGTGNSINLSGNVISSNKIYVNDGIVLNANTSGVPSTDAKIEIVRGSSANAYIVWNESVDKWQLFDGSVVANIAAATGNISISKVADDLTPNLGGNLNTNSYSILSTVANVDMRFFSNANISFQSNTLSNTFAISLNGFSKWQEQSLNFPAASAGNTWLFAKNLSVSYGTTLTGGGGTGLHVVTSGLAANVSEELVSKTKAIFYSLIL